MKEKVHEPSTATCFHSQAFVDILVNEKHMFCTGNGQNRGKKKKKKDTIL